MNNGHRPPAEDRGADGLRAQASELTRPRRRILGSIGTHLSALVAVQLVLVLGLIGFAGFQDFRSARTDAAISMRSSAELAAEYVEGEIDENRNELEQMPQYAELLGSESACAFTDPEQQQEWSDDGLTSRFYLVHQDGTNACPDAEPIGFAEQTWFKNVVTSQESVEAGPITDPSSDHQFMFYATAIAQYDTVIVFSVDLSSIVPALERRFGKTTPKPSFFVASADRSVEMSSAGGRSGRTITGTGFGRELTDANRTYNDLTGTEHIFAEADVAELGWHVFAGISTADALRVARDTLRDRVALALVMVLVVLAAAFFLHRRLVRPIRSLARATGRIAEGDLSTRATPSGPVELRNLAESFNAMAGVRANAEAALKKVYRAEQRAADELREIDGMRQAFLMAISHELRTPLTSVVGYASFLAEAREEMSEDELEKSINSIANQAQRLERLLLDLLDIERLTRGCVEPNLKDTDVRELVMHAIERSSGGQRIKAPIAKPVPAFVDPALVERIVENLVNNAVKHTPEDAKIWVKASRRNGDLKLTVEDSGLGVPDELKLAIFEPFKQGDVPSHAPGTGVGLSLVSQFAKLHGGRAWVEDRKGGGASFHVVLPAKPHEPKRRNGVRKAEKVSAAA